MEEQIESNAEKTEVEVQEKDIIVSYETIIQAINDVCNKIQISFSKEEDGRIISAVKEKEYLKLLEDGLKENNSKIKFEIQPVDRWWWDFRVNDIPFNLKLTNGGTDNAFNKVAIIYSITGKEVEKKNMNYNQFFKYLKELPNKKQRDIISEYHYLVVNKNNGSILIKSILDIHTYKSNPSNDLQINWSNEYKNIEYKTKDEEFIQKIKELLKTIQASVKQLILSLKEFAEADIDKLSLE